MKLKIERAFTDKYTQEPYTKGDTVEFEEARAKELLADPRKLVSEVKETKRTGKRSKK
jgi:hypothetical protein